LLFVPFTEQYARESVPRQFWDSPRFKRINRQLTALWGWVFVALIPSHIIAGAIKHQAGEYDLQLGHSSRVDRVGGQAHLRRVLRCPRRIERGSA
jgi:hypothetical protein